MIYFMRAKGTPYVKVGLSDNPESRKRQCQTGNHLELHVEATYFGDTARTVVRVG